MRGDALVGGRRADRRRAAVDLDLAETARREPHDDALHAAVAHQKVGAEAEHGDGNFLRQRPHQEGEILRIRRHRQKISAGPPARNHTMGASGWSACSVPRKPASLSFEVRSRRCTPELKERARILLPEGEGGCGAAG